MSVTSCFLSARKLVVAVVSLAFFGCAQSQIIKEAVYIDKPCDRADDYAPAQWLNVRWIAVTIGGVNYAATPDGETLLGNLLRIKGDGK